MLIGANGNDMRILAGCHGNVVEFTSVHLTKRLHDHSLNDLQLLRVLRARGW